jgi:N-acetylglucosaminyl-diphospho-decaprenol L-rhamnosyltransferase
MVANPCTVVTLNWNGGEVLPGMIRSLVPFLEASGSSLIVFDNGSEDGSDREALREFGGFRWFRLVRSDANLGFAAGANRSLSGAEGEIAVLANNDTVFLPGSLEALLEGLGRHPSAGIAGPRLLWPDGRLQRSMRDFPFASRLVVEHLPLFRRLSARWADHSRERRADWLVGAVLAIRMQAFREIGGFDEGYFFYHEETDLQYRMAEAGWETWFVPASEVMHLEGFSATRKYGRDTTLRYIPAKLRFLRKHGGPGSVTAFRLLMTVLALGRYLAGVLVPGLRSRDTRCSAPYFAKAMSALWRGPEAAPAD